MKNKKILFSIIFFCIAVVLILGLNKKLNDKNTLIDEINSSILQKKKIELSNYDVNKEKKDEVLVALAINKILSNKNIKAIDDLKTAADMENTKLETKILALKLLIEQLINYDEIEEALYYIDKINDFTEAEWNKSFPDIMAILNQSMIAKIDLDHIIEIYLNVLKYKNLTSECENAIRNNLGAMYAIQGNYAEATKYLLDIINASEMKEDYYYVKSVIDLSNILVRLGNYSLAEMTFKIALSVDLYKNIENYRLKIYAYENLCNLYLEQEKYDEFFEYIEILDTYIDRFEDKERERYIVDKKLLVTKAYMYKNELELAKQMLEEIKIQNSSQYLNNEVFVKLIFGKTAEKAGDKEKAVNIFLDLYTNNKARLKVNDKRNMLNSIIGYYEEKGNQEKQIYYYRELKELYENNSSKIGNTYVTNIVDMFKKKNDLIRLNKFRLIIETVLIIVLAVGTIITIIIKKILKKSTKDSLSNLYNRGQFDKMIKKACQKGKRYTLIIFDIDDFKCINDTYGHAFGDEVIKSISKVLLDKVGIKGKVFRYGGEEFAIIINPKIFNSVVSLAEDIRSEVEILQWEYGIRVTVSGGVAEIKESVEETFNIADKNLYTSKQNGKNLITY